MYARNLSRSHVRASPSFPPPTEVRDENSYRQHIPPGYTGNRFREPAPETATKHHPPSHKDTPVPESPYTGTTEAEAGDAWAEPWEKEEGAPSEEEKGAVVPADSGRSASVTTKDSGAAAITEFFHTLRDRVTWEDLLLVCLILTLALEGEDAEGTILLLALLLLIK